MNRPARTASWGQFIAACVLTALAAGSLLLSLGHPRAGALVAIGLVLTVAALSTPWPALAARLRRVEPWRGRWVLSAETRRERRVRTHECRVPMMLWRPDESRWRCHCGQLFEIERTFIHPDASRIWARVGDGEPVGRLARHDFRAQREAQRVIEQFEVDPQAKATLERAERRRLAWAKQHVQQIGERYVRPWPEDGEDIDG